MDFKMDFPVAQVDNGNFVLYNQLFALGKNRTPQQEIQFQNLFTLLSDYLVSAQDYNEIADNYNQMKKNLIQVDRDVAQLYLQDAIYRLLGEISGRMPLTQSRFCEMPNLAPINSIGHIDFTKAYCSSAVQGTDNITVDSMIHGNIYDFLSGDVETYDYRTPVTLVSEFGSLDNSNGDKIVADSENNLYAVYSFISQIKVKKSIDNGATWTDTGFPSIVGYGQYEPAIAIDSNDCVHVIWHGTDVSSPANYQIKYSKFTTSWSAWINISVVAGYTQDSTSIAIDDDDYLHVVWHGTDASSTSLNQIKYSKFTTSWSSWINMALVSGYEQHRPTVAIDGNNYVHVCWFGRDSVNTSAYQIKYSKFTTSWSAWINIQVISGNFQIKPSMIIDSLNNIHIVWYGTASGVTGYQIKYSKFTTSWSAWINITPVGGYSQTDPVITIDKDDNLHVVWQGVDSTHTSPQIKYSKFTTSWSSWENITNTPSGEQSRPAICRTLRNFQKPLTIWMDAQISVLRLYGLWTVGVNGGDEVTLQDATNKEHLIIKSIADPVITFTSNIVNSYTGDVNLYKSSIKIVGDNWEFEGIKKFIEGDAWDETSTPPSGTWDSMIVMGTDIYARGASPYAMWKYDTVAKTWDKTSTPPSGIWSYPVAIGTDIYVKQSASPYAMWKYDTVTRTWDETSTPPSGAWSLSIVIGTDIYAKGANPYAMWKYDTVAKTWDETSTPPSGDWSYPIAIGTDIYVKQSSSPYAMWKYNTVAKTWDETSTPPSGDWSYPIAIGADIYARGTSTYAMWKYDTVAKTWDETSTPPSGMWYYTVAIGTNIYVKQSVSPYAMWKYDTVAKTWDETSTPPSGTWDSMVVAGVDIYARGISLYTMWKYSTAILSEAPITDIDIRLNINPYTDVGNISMWLLNNQLGTYIAYASITGIGINEDYVQMSSVTTDLGTEDEIYFVKAELTPDAKVTAKINITRPTTATDVEIKQIIGGVF